MYYKRVYPKFTYPTDEERQELLKAAGEPCDRFIRESERKKITSFGPTTIWKWTKAGFFPMKVKFGYSTGVWLLSDILHWMKNYPNATSKTTEPKTSSN